MSWINYYQDAIGGALGTCWNLHVLCTTNRSSTHFWGIAWNISKRKSESDWRVIWIHVKMVSKNWYTTNCSAYIPPKIAIKEGEMRPGILYGAPTWGRRGRGKGWTRRRGRSTRRGRGTRYSTSRVPHQPSCVVLFHISLEINRTSNYA